MREKLNTHFEELNLDTYSNELYEVKVVSWKEDNKLVKYSLLELSDIEVIVVIRHEEDKSPEIMEMELRGVTETEHNRVIGNFLNIYMMNEF